MLNLDQLTDDERVAFESRAEHYGMQILEWLFAGIKAFADDAGADGTSAREIRECVMEDIWDCVPLEQPGATERNEIRIVIAAMLRLALEESAYGSGQP
jgi:hypothetical protein